MEYTSPILWVSLSFSSLRLITSYALIAYSTLTEVSAKPAYGHLKPNIYFCGQYFTVSNRRA